MMFEHNGGQYAQYMSNVHQCSLFFPIIYPIVGEILHFSMGFSPMIFPLLVKSMIFSMGFSKATSRMVAVFQLLQEEHEVGLCDLTGSCGKGRNDENSSLGNENLK